MHAHSRSHSSASLLHYSHFCSQDEKLGRLLSGSLTQNYDAVIGSLPKALSSDERLRIRESMPMSPALGALQQIPEVCRETQGWHRYQRCLRV
jgi:hypothetical protein